MTKTEQQQFFESFTAKMRGVMMSKGDDYAGADRLSNFKQTGAQSLPGQENQAEKAALLQISNKVTRLGELLSGKKANHESIDDSILDCANYLLLLAMIRHDLKPSHAV